LNIIREGLEENLLLLTKLSEEVKYAFSVECLIDDRPLNNSMIHTMGGKQKLKDLMIHDV
jgi:hypothetical protein